MGVSFEFREYGTLSALLDALEQGEIDLIPSKGWTELLIAMLNDSHTADTGNLLSAAGALVGDTRHPAEDRICLDREAI
jgi:hypothetical protein